MYFYLWIIVGIYIFGLFADLKEIVMDDYIKIEKIGEGKVKKTWSLSWLDIIY